MPSESRTSRRPIRLLGCRQHNLRGFDLEIARGRWTAISGVSGSGKSSLAFDTLYAEGQRRYVESFGAYARQFLDRMGRPALDGVEGIPPAIAIAQGNEVRTARSTVATVTELGDYLKILFARLGVRHCDRCAKPIQRRDPPSVAEELIARAAARDDAAPWLVGFRPPTAGRDVAELRASLLRRGFVRVATRAGVERLADLAAIPPSGEILVVIDRVAPRASTKTRLVDALEQAFAHGGGSCAAVDPSGEWIGFDRSLRCVDCDLRFQDPAVAQFSFNHPSGACPDCSGFGRKLSIDEDLVVPDRSRSLAEGAVKPWSTPSTEWERDALAAWCRAHAIPMVVPYDQLPRAARELLWRGEPGGFDAGRWHGIDGWFRWLETRAYKMHVRVLLARYRSARVCESCGGTRFRPEVRSVRIDGQSIADVYGRTLRDLRAWFAGYAAPSSMGDSVEIVLEEVRSRLGYLCEVGLGYLTPDRATRTLSGGEMERVNLTTAVGSRLVNALFVLDEPSVGLHARDNDRLIALLRRLVDHGNTVVVVEHDPALLLAADELVDLGPGAGEAGGRITYQGPPRGAAAAQWSSTGSWLAGKRRMEPRERRATDGPALEVRGARAHNLQGIDVRFPIGALSVVTGVSGSGKSTLVIEVLHRALARARGKRTDEPGACDEIRGGDRIGDVILVDSTPLGRSPKSVVATACGAYDLVRKTLAALPEARARKLAPSTFSFNAKGGRCEACEGAGFERVEMQFLADVFLPCNECGGDRFRPEIRRLKLRGKTIGEILGLTVDEAVAFFSEDDPRIRRKLEPVAAVGLGYLRIGQSVTTISGGEAQRLKLASSIADDLVRDGRGAARRRKGTLFLFDEPTTGLHLDDVQQLVRTLDRLVRAGHTVVAIEHHLDFIRQADQVVDLGPEAGSEGGRVVCQGPPEAIALCPESITGRYMRDRPAETVRPRNRNPRPASDRRKAAVRLGSPEPRAVPDSATSHESSPASGRGSLSFRDPIS